MYEYYYKYITVLVRHVRSVVCGEQAMYAARESLGWYLSAEYIQSLIAYKRLMCLSVGVVNVHYN